VPAFTTDGLLDYMVELIVCEDEVRASQQIFCSDFDALPLERLSNLLTVGHSDVWSLTSALLYRKRIYLIETRSEKRYSKGPRLQKIESVSVLR
jgi:hypothetical protein